jgi:hypothetical protein
MQRQKFTKHVLAIQLFGAVMFAVVCAAYILGLPSDTVLHGELAFRVVIGVFGAVLFVGSIVMLAAAYVTR